MNELHKILRDKTLTIHNKLENESILQAYLSSELTQSKFIAILKKTYLAYLDWQMQLDLNFLKYKIANEFHINLYTEKLLTPEILATMQTSSPKIPSLNITKVEHYLGCAYVFEGSKLGAKVIYNSLANNQDLHPENISYYKFLAEPENQKLAWPQWLDNLEKYAIHNKLDFMHIAAGAENCFACLYAWFN